MPFGDYEDFDACVAANSDKSDPEAYCAEIKRSIEGNAALSDSEQKALQRSACGEGHVEINGECVPVKDVDAPPSILSTPQHLTLKNLDTEPIERVEESDDRVRYKSLKLLSPGVWSDAGSQTATYYPPEGIANLQAEYDESRYDGPPVNIMHDLDVEEWEAHEPSVAGHVDPSTLDTDDDGNLFGDVVFDTGKGAGQFADENLKSTLENEGTVGFGGPSVEIPAEGLQQSHDQVRDMPRVDGGLLTGVAMVMDPASKSVNFAREAARRPIAMSDSGESIRVLTHEDDSMSQHKKIRDALLSRQLQVGDIEDDAQNIADELGVPIDEVMAVLDPLMDPPEEEEGEGEEMQEDDDDEEFPEEEEEEEEQEMQDEPGDEPDDPVDALQEQVQNLSSRLEDLEDAVAQAMTAEDVDAELEDAAGQKLADMDSVKELEEAREELDRRLEALESRGKESKTLADSDGGVDYSDADSGIDFDPATGSMSR